MAQSKIVNVFPLLFKRKLSTKSNSKVIAPLQQAALSERCIVVNNEDKKIGSASKYDCHRIKPDGSLPLHRAFSVFLFNKQGEILLQKRSANKVTFPLHVSNTCCSHPLADIAAETIEGNGEGVKSAAIRRLNYELGIPTSEIAMDDFVYLTRIHYKAADNGTWGEHEIDYILFLQKDVNLSPNPDEVSEVAYVSENNLDNYLKTLNDPLTPWFQLIIKSRLPLWWKNLSDLSKFQDHKNIQKF